jgi:hypothetical protein
MPRDAEALAYGWRVLSAADKVLTDAAILVQPAGEEASHLRCPAGQTVYSDDADFVPEIASIMFERQWPVGAKYQARWLSGKANQLSGDAPDWVGSDYELAVEEEDIDWVLTFARAKAAFDTLIQPETFTGGEAKSLLLKRIAAIHSATGRDVFRFGDLAKHGRELESEYCRLVTIGDSLADLPRLLFFTDDLHAAFNQFTGHVIPHGRAALRPDGGFDVEISEVGVYFRDVFDFSNDQPLGDWQKPAEFIAATPVYRPGPRCSSEWFRMSNATYRAYRDRTGMGEDFLIYTQVRSIVLDSPVLLRLGS